MLDELTPNRTRWLRFGLLVAGLHLLFLVALLFLLRWNLTVGIAFAVAGGVAFAVLAYVAADRIGPVEP